jgi:hypothetical protein
LTAPQRVCAGGLDHLSHAGLHEDPETFNRATLDFLLRQRS